MNRMDNLSSHRTAIYSSGGETRVIYVNTAIVEFDGESVTLRSGGYETVTTKRKMNQASRQFDLGYSVLQRDFAWYVTKPDGVTVPFSDGMTFAACGGV